MKYYRDRKGKFISKRVFEFRKSRKEAFPKAILSGFIGLMLYGYFLTLGTLLLMQYLKLI